MKNRRLALVVAGVFTAVNAVACLALAGILARLYYSATVEPTGSGGIGAVSAGISETLLEALLFVAAAVVVNVSVKTQASQRGRTAIWIRRAHLVFTVLTFWWPAMIVPLISMERSMLESFSIVIAAGAVVSAVHGAFGVFAIRLLRRSVDRAAQA